ncbi:MAG: hypothetical protein Q8N30_17045 [Methylococcales bacterium]|nr:hypothetical protein [Methylococcales bacterium]
MKRLSLLLTVFCFALLADSVASAAAPLNIIPEALHIVRAEFGLFNASGFVPSNRVPLVEGQTYGWRIVVKTNKAKVRWREEFTLPVAPVTWGDAEVKGMSSVSENRRVSVMEREETPVDGVMVNSWAVAAGDPVGHHVMRVLIDNRYEYIFQFDVQSAPQHTKKVLQ